MFKVTKSSFIIFLINQRIKTKKFKLMKKIYLFIFILSILLINHGFLLSKTTKIKSKLQDLAVYQESLNVKTTSRETSRN